MVPVQELNCARQGQPTAHHHRHRRPVPYSSRNHRRALYFDGLLHVFISFQPHLYKESLFICKCGKLSQPADIRRVNLAQAESKDSCSGSIARAL